ncbi:hypothetical protein BJY24_005554 [Nocardia transvalensis]|uniref:Uncharacterized protein n=1 Tax=Nocardia transvalensis TaxID=37333 RepID=A0A7W9PI70_9NOCA|nr:hypothetical protein [Nocardia transvalensis]
MGEGQHDQQDGHATDDQGADPQYGHGRRAAVAVEIRGPITPRPGRTAVGDTTVPTDRMPARSSIPPTGPPYTLIPHAGSIPAGTDMSGRNRHRDTPTALGSRSAALASAHRDSRDRLPSTRR